MFELSQAFHRARRRRNRAPIVLFTLRNAFGARVYADRRPDEASAGLAAPAAADGRFLADGGRLAGWGSLPLLERSARVLAYGRLRESLAPLRGELWANLGQEEAGTLNVELSNAAPTARAPSAAWRRWRTCWARRASSAWATPRCRPANGSPASGAR